MAPGVKAIIAWQQIRQLARASYLTQPSGAKPLPPELEATTQEVVIGAYVRPDNSIS